MNPIRSQRRRLQLLLALLAIPATATTVMANSIAQNLAWTIDRPESETRHRIVAYGDSIFAGYRGSISKVAIWASPTVSGDYASARWGTDVETVRRTKSGAIAKEIYEDKVVDDKRYMQTPETRVVMLEMCGNDALQARNNLHGQDGTCDYSRLDEALADCTEYQELAMIFINANASATTRRKIISTLYYPGYDDDNEPAGCTDTTLGGPPNKQDVFLPYLLRMNWRACNFGVQHGFQCADTFAGFMGADFDSNGDGKKDAAALRFRRGESEEEYVTRLGTTLRSTIRDPNMHFFRPQTTFDYIQSDDVHPTYDGGTKFLGLLGGSGKGSSAPRYPLQAYADGRVPIWKSFGHERMGFELKKFNPPTPD